MPVLTEPDRAPLDVASDLDEIANRVVSALEDLDQRHAEQVAKLLAKVRAQRAGLDAFFFASGDLICLLDSAGVIRRASPAWGAFAKTSVVDTLWADLFEGPLHAQALKLLADANSSVSFSATLERSQGSISTCWTLSPLPSKGWAVVGRVCSAGASTLAEAAATSCSDCPLKGTETANG